MSDPDAAARESEPVPPIEGVYCLCHDGWFGALTLRRTSADVLEGRFFDVRTERTHDVQVTVGGEDARRVEFTIPRFNQMVRQVFVGYGFGPRGEAFAGTTVWRDLPFGFFARRASLFHLSRYGDPNDRVARSDFLGAYTVWHEGGLGTLEVLPAPRGLIGRYRSAGGAVSSMPVRTGGEHDHQISVTLPVDGEPFQATGYLFTRPKNGISGTATWKGRPAGFYMIKFRGADR